MTDVKMIATREAYGKALADLADKYPKLVVLDADLSAATKTELFNKSCPDRFFNCGVAEANMMSIAAGLATMGFTPFVSSFAMFAAGRAFDQIRNSIAYPRLNVKIGASHAGISVGEDGASHQCNEDIALMRAIPGMTVINPADAVETAAAVECILRHDGPVYLRLGRMATPVYNDAASYRFEIGRGITLRDGTDVTVIATGLMVAKAIEAAKVLASEKISVRVINIHTIKPIDVQLVIKAANETGAIVTVEEHNIIGGLGSAVAEVVSAHCPVKVRKIGVRDVFGYSGPAADLLREFGLTAENIAKTAKEAYASKR